jgi:hypothetical protein
MTHKFETLRKQTTYKKDSKKSGGQVRTSWTAAQHRDSFLKTAKQFSGQFLHRQLNCSPTEKKENKKSPRFAFLKISFADTHLAHLLLPLYIFLMEWQKQKSQILPTHHNIEY